jgi:hypothetical protein
MIAFVLNPSQRGSRGVVILFCILATLLFAFIARAQVFSDGRDGWSLFDEHLVNRQLFEQLAVDGQQFRLGGDLGLFAVASDAAVGGQVALGDNELSRFHGYFIFDGYVAFRPLEGIDANLNLTLFNPSASDGYRVSYEAIAGLGLHLYHDLFKLGEKPLRGDVVALDLGVVTLGRGLLLEQVPLEGHMVGLSWSGLYLREMFAGRVLWGDDDLQSVALGALDGHVEILFVRWLTRKVTEFPYVDIVLPAEPAIDSAAETSRLESDYIGLSFDWPLQDTLRLAGEYVARLRNSSIRSGFLLRTDYLNPALWRLQVHLGYQLRYYQQGFGPRRRLLAPDTIPNLPWREDVYVTNSFEYYGISEYYDQWSHTVMLELRVEIAPWLRLIADAEYWARIVIDPNQEKRVVYLPRGGRAPGVWHDIYYRAGFELRPWPDLPHRFNAFITNKLVASGRSAVEPSMERFVHDHLVLFEIEVFL